MKGQNVLIVRDTLEKTSELFGLEAEKTAALLEECRKRLFELRQSRPRPHRDDKILTAWNGKEMGMAHGLIELVNQY